jgi:hypothetical protein
LSLLAIVDRSDSSSSAAVSDSFHGAVTTSTTSRPPPNVVKLPNGGSTERQNRFLVPQHSVVQQSMNKNSTTHARNSGNGGKANGRQRLMFQK